MADDLVLDLSKAESSGFDALDGGTYNCTIVEASMSETKGGPNSALPGGTPMLKVQFRVEDEPYVNRRLFSQYVIAGKTKADGTKNDKQQVTLGILVGFLEAVGYDSADIKSGSFDLRSELDAGNFGGLPCRVACKKKRKYGITDELFNDPKVPENEKWDNEVTGVKPPLQSEGGIE